MEYDYQNHYLLGSYQAQIIAVRSENDVNENTNFQNVFNDNSDIFNIAFLKSHDINIEESINSIDYSCSVKVLLKKNEIQNNLNIIEKLINDNLVIEISPNEKNLAKKIKINTNNDDLLEVEIKKGPISINKFNKALNKHYDISCHIKLTDSNDLKNEIYKNSILKRININGHNSKVRLSNVAILFITLFSVATVIILGILIYLFYTKNLCFCYQKIDPTSHW
jgi:hypothetical protein